MTNRFFYYIIIVMLQHVCDRLALSASGGVWKIDTVQYL